MKLSLWQRFVLWLRGYVFLYDVRRVEWSGSLPFYAFRCPKHGLVSGHPHGFYSPFSGELAVKYGNDLHKLTCPYCDRELRDEPPIVEEEVIVA